jgi:hypothetical protein
MKFLASLAIAAGALLSTASAQFAGAIDARSTPLPPEASRHLPPKTYSGVCPAIEFDQSWARVNGHYYIKFKPSNPSLPFEFVDLYVCTSACTRARRCPHSLAPWFARTHARTHSTQAPGVGRL